jgi:hypothetical protein
VTLPNLRSAAITVAWETAIFLCRSSIPLVPRAVRDGSVRRSTASQHDPAPTGEVGLGRCGGPRFTPVSRRRRTCPKGRSGRWSALLTASYGPTRGRSGWAGPERRRPLPGAGRDSGQRRQTPTKQGEEHQSGRDSRGTKPRRGGDKTGSGRRLRCPERRPPARPSGPDSKRATSSGAGRAAKPGVSGPSGAGVAGFEDQGRHQPCKHPRGGPTHCKARGTAGKTGPRRSRKQRCPGSSMGRSRGIAAVSRAD